jgi:hypothetical protein
MDELAASGRRLLRRLFLAPIGIGVGIGYLAYGASPVHVAAHLLLLALPAELVLVSMYRHFDAVPFSRANDDKQIEQLVLVTYMLVHVAALMVAMLVVHVFYRWWLAYGLGVAWLLAKQAAAERGVALDTVLADIDEYDFGTARWDLVTMIYAGNNQGWIERIKPSIKPGGLFVLEFFYKDPADSNAGDFTGIGEGELASAFAGWQILRDEVVEDVADCGKTKAKLVRFVARKP